MKIIGLIGGMSWESTVPYYRQINETVKERLGGLHSARIILYSLDFHEIERLQHSGDWQAAGAVLADAARALEAAGADFVVLCTNTMHIVAPAIEAAVRIPLLHIADPTADAIRSSGFSTVGLLGTRFTMEQAFYKERLHERHGLKVLVPASPTGKSFTESSTRNFASGKSSTNRVPNTAGSWPVSLTRAPKRSFLGAPRSRCWSDRTMRRFLFLTRPSFTRARRPSGRSRRHDSPSYPSSGSHVAGITRLRPSLKAHVDPGKTRHAGPSPDDTA